MAAVNLAGLHWTKKATLTIAWFLGVGFLLFAWINPQGATVFTFHHADRILGGAGDGLSQVSNEPATGISLPGVACPDTTFPVIGPCAGQPGPDVAADVRNSDGVAAP